MGEVVEEEMESVWIVNVEGTLFEEDDVSSDERECGSVREVSDCSLVLVSDLNSLPDLAVGFGFCDNVEF